MPLLLDTSQTEEGNDRIHRCNTSNGFRSPLNCLSREKYWTRKFFANSMRRKRFRRWVSDCTNTHITRRVLGPYCQDCGIRKAGESHTVQAGIYYRRVEAFLLFPPASKKRYWWLPRLVLRELVSFFCNGEPVWETKRSLAVSLCTREVGDIESRRCFGSKQKEAHYIKS